ncbi:MAG: DnaK suppressor protein [Microbacteriaceae bacterium]|nr:DnaK suppressor protein [Microbacteriaceae bacterium]
MSEELGRMRAETLATIAELDGQIARVTAARANANTDDEHDPEGSTIAFERSQADALRDAAQHRLAEIDAAEQRIRDGGYGRCEVCGEPIAEARLAARPLATRCIRHA